VECKNWSSKVDRREFDDLAAKLERRRGRANLGFLVSVGGFTAGVHSAQSAGRKDSQLIVLIDGPDLKRLVEATDRDSVLAELHQRAVISTRSSG